MIQPVANAIPPDEWVQAAKRLFVLPKPEHFTDYRHCCECAEHDETLLSYDVDSIGMEQLGNPGWDPLCFSSAAGLLYYMPALVRLTLQTLESSQAAYLDQFLFHLNRSEVLEATNLQQRQLIVAFLEYLIEWDSNTQNSQESPGMEMEVRSHPHSYVEFDIEAYADDLLNVLQTWHTYLEHL